MIKYLLILLILLSSCKKDDDGFRHYTVKAGKHYSNHLPKPIFNQHSVQVWFEVNETWQMPYTGGWNKIIGIGLGKNHDDNACRLSSRCDDGVMKVGMYTNLDGEDTGFVIDTVQYGTYYVDIAHSGGLWCITFNGKTYTAKAGKKYDEGYILFPYIGGEGTIDHPWIVPMKFN